MPIILSYFRSPKRRKLRSLLIFATIALAVVYVGGYAYLRHTHVFVRDGTGYTNNGKWIRTDSVRLMDEYYWSPHSQRMEFLSAIYFPLRKLEGFCWRVMPR